MALFSKLGNYKNTGLLILRLGIGIMFMMHGYPKLLAGPGKWAGIGSSMASIHVDFFPAFWGLMAGIAETFGGFLFLLGLAFRPACLFLAFTMTIAALHHLKAGEGLSGASHAIEDGLLFIGMLFVGPGKYSVDKK